MSVVDLGAAAEVHPAVERMRHEYDVAGCVARRVERLRLTVSLVLVALMLTLISSDVTVIVCSTARNISK